MCFNKNYNKFTRGADIDYMTGKEAGEKWSAASRQINCYCLDRSITGAVKMAGVRPMPKDVGKAMDGRTRQGKAQKHETV